MKQHEAVAQACAAIDPNAKRCRCGIAIPPGWQRCEPCRKALAMEDRNEAGEEIVARYEFEFGDICTPRYQ